MDSSPKLTFDPKVHQKEALQAWQKFVETGKVDRRKVPPMIADSWVRSRQKKVDPWNIPSTAYLPDALYQQRVDSHQFLIGIAKPFMEEVYSSLEESKYVVVLYDSDGYHLIRLGSFADFERARKYKIRPGLCFSEETLGTTGFSLVKQNLEAVRIIGCQHYHAFLHYIVGSYAPIRSSEAGELIGVIGIAGARTMPNDHTLGMVLSTAKAIEGSLKLHKMNRVLFVYGRALQTTINNMSDAVLIVDREGMVFEMNSVAMDIFDLDRAAIIGGHVSNLGLASLSKSVVKVLQSRDSKGEEIELAVDGHRYLSTIKFVEDEKHELAGVVVLMKDLKYLTRIATLSEGPLRYTIANMVGKSDYMEGVKDFVNIVAPSEAHIIIEGESGSGKEVLAQVIHNTSPRSNEPFVAVDCSAIPSELFESMFFGHEKGSFTNAYRTHIGKFELADKGTLFLDEIAEMPLDMQVKLLRVLEEKKIERIGSRGTINVDVRVIAATNKDIMQEVRVARFRRDLFYRLNVFRVKLPPLRERKEDIPDLVDYFVKQVSFSSNKRVRSISSKFYQRLMEYDWPGNIRELRNAVYHAVTLMDGKTLEEGHLDNFFQQAEQIPDLLPKSGYNRTLSAIEREAIKGTLVFAQGNKRKAARILGIGRATLHRKIKAYNLHT